MGSGEGRAMTAERLAAIREHVEMAYHFWMEDETAIEMVRDYPDLPHDFVCDGDELLTEVERLRAALDAAEAREAAQAKTIARALAWRPTQQKGGGDGQRREGERHGG